MTHVLRIATRFFNTPLLLTPDVASVICAGLAERFGVDGGDMAADLPSIDASRFRGVPKTDANGRPTNLYRIEGGIAIVPVLGELVNRGAWIGASSGLTSYEGLDAQLRLAAADRDVRGIVLDINSPGGEASGAMEAGALVRELSAQKPIVAFVNGMAASAAYAIASGANHIVASPSAILGSIGVVMVHIDRSEAITKGGVKPTIIHAGAYKADLSSYQALSDDARARIQGHVDAVYDLFVGTVAGHRGLPVEAVRKTEAGIFLGPQAVTAGLADAVGTLDDAFAYIGRSNSSAGFTSPTGGSMSTSNPAAGGETGITQAQVDAAVAAATLAGSTAATARIRSILTHADAKGRADLAMTLALDTDMSVDAAAKVLQSVPVVAPVAPAAPASGSHLGALVPRPDVQPDAPANSGAKSQYELGAAAFAAAVPSHMRTGQA